MASPFQKYQGGIQPVTGIAEAGQSIGNMYAQMGDTLAKGISEYYENSAKWDMASSEADVVASDIANTQRLLLSHPAYAPLAQSLNPYIEQLGKVKSSSLPKALSILNASKAAYQSTMQKFPLYEAIRREREATTFNEGLPEANQPTVRSVPVATAKGDLVWDYTKGFGENWELAGKYYDQFKAAHPDVKMVPKSQWLGQWVNDLPTQIANDHNVPKAVRDKSIELINNGFLNVFGLDDVPEYYNPNRPSESQPKTPSLVQSGGRIVPAGTNVQDTTAKTPEQSQTQRLQARIKELSDEYKALNEKLGTGWFDVVTGEDERIRQRLSSISEAINNYRKTIESLNPLPRVPAANTNSVPTPPAGVTTRDGPTPEQAQGRVTPQPEPDMNEVIEVPPLPAPQYDAPSTQAPVQKNNVPIPEAIVRSGAENVKNLYDVITDPENEVIEVPPLPAPQYDAPSAQAPAPEVKAPAKAPAPQAPAPQAVVPEKVAPPQTQAEPKVQAPTPTYDVKPQAAPQARPTAPAQPQARPQAQPQPETRQFEVSVSGGRNETKFATFQVSPSSQKVKVVKGQQLFNIGQKYGVNLNAIAKANGFAPNIMPNELFEISERNGGIVIPDRVKKEDLPPAKRDDKRYVSSGGRTPFAMVKPLVGGVPMLVEEGEQPAEGTTQQKLGTRSSRKPITPVGTTPIDPVKDEENRIASGMSKEDWAKVKVARSHVLAENTKLGRKSNAYSQTVDWLTQIRDSVADGKSDLVDFGPYGQWESIHPTMATTIQVGFDAGTILLSGMKINKLQQGKSAIDKSKMVADKAKVAYEAAMKARAEALAKAPKMITQQGAVGEELARRTAQRLAAEEAAIFEQALKKAGVEVNAEVLQKIKGMNVDMMKEGAKGVFWTGLFEALYGVRNAAPDQATSDDETRAALNNTLDGVRKLRTGYLPMLGFGQGEGFVSELTGGWKPLTPEEQVNIVGYLDGKLDELEAKRDNFQTQFKLNSTNLFDNQKLLSLYGSLKQNSPSSQEVDASGYKPSRPLGTQSIIAAKTFEVPQTVDQKREALRGFMQKRLGYVPAGFETMFQSQFPEATLKMQETPYGVMFHDGQSWKPLKTGGEKAGPEDIAKSASVMFGQPMPDGTFKPTEFIKGSGIKLGGIGSFGTPEAAAKFRENYPKLLKAKKLANELKALNEETFRSLDPSKWGRAAAKVAELIAQMRITLIGVGSVSDFEQQILRDLVQDPTAFFSLQSTTRAKYQAMIENIDDSLMTMPQSFGLTVEFEKDKANALLAARQAYQEAKGWSELTPEQRAQIKASVSSK